MELYNSNLRPTVCAIYVFITLLKINIFYIYGKWISRFQMAYVL